MGVRFDYLGVFQYNSVQSAITLSRERELVRGNSLAVRNAYIMVPDQRPLYDTEAYSSPYERG